MQRFFFYLSLIFIFQNCARRGNPTGGPKDENAPIIIQTFPKFNTTEFNKNEIKIYFDEYIKLKDLQKQLVVSPPLKYPAIILPQGIPTKKIFIKIKDTLKPNTTYVFSFGNSIEDNNEGNVLTDFKYVFSTGKKIDSLELKGEIKDVFKQENDDFISILLFNNKRYKDSIVFNEKPDYIANTLDSTTFKFTNLKEGKYRIIALKENNKDHLYQPKDEKIAFLDSIIEIPTDKKILLNLFKIEPEFKVKQITEISKGHLLIGYQGNIKNSKIDIVKIDSFPINKIENFKSYSFKDSKTDSIHFFFNHKKTDSIKLRISKKTYSQEFLIKTRSKKTDSLTLSSNIKGTLHPNDTLTIVSNIPINEVDKTKISLKENDSIPVSFKLQKKQVNLLQILFDKKQKSRYGLTILPKGITSIFDQSNDTIKIGFQTKKETYYGSITLDIKTNKLPLIVELLDNKNKIIHSQYLSNNTNAKFDKLIPGKYNIRVIYDKNKNKKWDSGDFLKQLQPEPVHYLNKKINLKENWFLNETLTIE
jgi:uncharacterized protein (DUF2141 family)